MLSRDMTTGSLSAQVRLSCVKGLAAHRDIFMPSSAAKMIVCFFRVDNFFGFNDSECSLGFSRIHHTL